MRPVEAEVTFFSWTSPWPGHGGRALRTQGLIREIAKEYKTDLIILGASAKNISSETSDYKLNDTIFIPLKRDHLAEKMCIVYQMMHRKIPYHPSVVRYSFKHTLGGLDIKNPNRVFYCAGSHFFELAMIEGVIYDKWIIDQFDVDAQYWLIRKKELINPIKRMAAGINQKLASDYYSDAYTKAGCVISVCKEDKEITSHSAPGAHIEVIENGIDTNYYKPESQSSNLTPLKTPTLLFTGTSNDRNIKGLTFFLKDLFPGIVDSVPEVKLIVAGRFDKQSQKRLRKIGDVEFTGALEDIRPIYGKSDVFINPFEESYGSKLKLSQALSMGICIVTTREGARGFQLIDKQNALIAENNEDFIEKTVHALRNCRLKKEIGENGREYAKERLDWNVLGESLRKIIDRVLAGVAPMNSDTLDENSRSSSTP